MKPLQFSCIIDGITAKADKTLQIKLGTQELEPDEVAKILAFRGLQIWVAMTEDPI
jgi:hypothetical protein